MNMKMALDTKVRREGGVEGREGWMALCALIMARFASTGSEEEEEGVGGLEEEGGGRRQYAGKTPAVGLRRWFWV